jgi:glycosyltransferase involved in cell wall biosynthesis
MYADRLRAEGFGGHVHILRGLYAGPVGALKPEALEPAVVFAGRHVREKRVFELVSAFALVYKGQPQLRLDLYGTGPERERIEKIVAELGLQAVVINHGMRSEKEVSDAIASAACVATASEREGYGLIVVEAAARGTPSVVVTGPNNAALELVEEGVNGTVARTASPHDLADSILRAVGGGASLRASTLHWFVENQTRLSFDAAFLDVLAGYGLGST